MNCHEFAAALDEHRGSRLFASVADAERALLERHLAGCADCAAAYAAAVALEADPVPAMPAVFPAGVARAARDRGRAGLRPRAPMLRFTALAGGLALGGTALAVLGWSLVTQVDGDRAAATAAAGAVATEAAGPRTTRAPAFAADTLAPPSDDLFERVEVIERAEYEAFAESLLSSLPDGEYFMLINVPPEYPVANGPREGNVVVEFTIAATGDVEDVSVVSSSDPVFEAPAVESIARSKYRPRVVNGEARAVRGVRTKISFAIDDSVPPDAAPNLDELADRIRTGTLADAARHELRIREFRGQNGQVPAPAPSSEYTERIGNAYACLEQNDLRCMELELDYILATESLTPRQQSEVWNALGFVYHRQGLHERAIDAYERALGGREGASWHLRTLARIQYERSLYQAALDTMTRYLDAVEEPIAADLLFVERLRGLGAARPEPGPAPAGPAEQMFR